ncbi:uncharacterized protein [Rutidosis leptorrhynchoides]|uniref:uncharacterized protein n=1 Tax=Rutidosis leptorrhynchoides TaxID=125765 RepID=UPI003A996AFA
MFDGKTDSASEHIKQFNELCALYKNKEVSPYAFNLRLFPYSLKGDAKAWLKSQPSGSIRTYEDLHDKFIDQNFSLKFDESLAEAWERFKRMLHECPQHGLEVGTVVQIFYHMIDEHTRGILDSLAGGFGCETCKGKYLTKDFDINDMPMVSEGQGNFLGYLRKRELGFDDFPVVEAMNRGNKSFNNYQWGGASRSNNYQGANSGAKRGIDQATNTESTSDNSNVGEGFRYIVLNNGVETAGYPKVMRKRYEIEENDPPVIIEKKSEESVVKKYKEPIPYPKALKKEKLASQYQKFVEMIKQISMNLPLAEVLKGMPNYGKFLKDLISSKGKYHKVSTTFLHKECSVILVKRMMPPKLGDPGSFLIPCAVGDSEVYDALADLGASIILIPYSLYLKLFIGDLKSTRMGIAEDILVKVETLVFPVDFVVLEIKEDTKAQFPVIIASHRSGNEKGGLISILKAYKKASSWKITDIPRMSLSYCTHKILLEDDLKPVVQRQRMSNPNMKEVVKKEVVKFLDAGLIYPISDSPWVGLERVVPKKGVQSLSLMKGISSS